MFSPTSGAGSAPELIPNGTLAWALINVGGAKQSKTSGGTYYPVTLTIIGGEYEGRKVFDMIPDVQDDRNGEKWRKMGITSITRIFESSGHFKVADPKSYEAFTGKETLAIMSFMDGQRVAIKVKVEKNTDPARPIANSASPDTDAAWARAKRVNGEGAQGRRGSRLVG